MLNTKATYEAANKLQESSRKHRFQHKMAASPTTPENQPINVNYQIWPIPTRNSSLHRNDIPSKNLEKSQVRGNKLPNRTKTFPIAVRFWRINYFKNILIFLIWCELLMIATTTPQFSHAAVIDPTDSWILRKFPFFFFIYRIFACFVYSAFICPLSYKFLSRWVK